MWRRELGVAPIRPGTEKRVAEFLSYVEAIPMEVLSTVPIEWRASRNKRHYDPQGKHIPALWADQQEIFALADVLRELGAGIVQCGGGRAPELKEGLMARTSSKRPAVR